MITNPANPPIILTFSSLDPSGCGGVQADIETAASLGCHCAPIVTAIGTQGSQSAGGEQLAVDPTIVIEQARSILETMAVSTIKLGFLGSVANAEAVYSILQDYADIPVVSHPALYLSDADDGEHQALVQAYPALVLAQTSIALLSRFEAHTISQENDTIATSANALLSHGCELALITGTGEHTQAFQNSLYGPQGLISNYHWEQESPSDDAASSTLASSCAAYLAHGLDLQAAVEQAQNYTWQTMCASRDLGFGQRVPHRFYWADKNIASADGLPAKKSAH